MFLHVINLDTVGGVEELFAHFIVHAPGVHAVYVTGGRIHPHFQDAISESAEHIIYEKYFGRLLLPKSLRLTIAKRRLHDFDYDKVVLWNKIEPLSKVEALFQEKPVIYYEHGASWMCPQTTELAPFFRRMNGIVANSFASRSLMQLKWGVAQDITVVENPLRHDVHIRTEPKRPQSPLRLGFIGRLLPIKGAISLLKAVHILKDKGVSCTLTLAGDGMERPCLEKYIKDHGLQTISTFLGTIRNVVTFYDSIDLLVVPSIREPLGLVAVEAAARGVPVIASCVDGLAEVVEHMKTGILIQPTLPITDTSSCRLPDIIYDPINKKLSKPLMIDPQAIASAVLQFQKSTFYESCSMESIIKSCKRCDYKSFAEKLFTIFSR